MLLGTDDTKVTLKRNPKTDGLRRATQKANEVLLGTVGLDCHRHQLMQVMQKPILPRNCQMPAMCNKLLALSYQSTESQHMSDTLGLHYCRMLFVEKGNE